MKTPMTPFWSRRPARHRAVIYILVAYALLSACGTLQQTGKPAFVTTSGIRLYLQPLPQEAQHINFSIQQVTALAADGTEIALGLNFSNIISRELIGAQKHLTSTALPPGLYRGISLRLGAAEKLGEEGAAMLKTSEQPLVIEQAFEISKNQTQTLFLSLKPNDLISSGFQFTPTFFLAKPTRVLKSLIGMVSNPEQHSLLMINKNSMQVADTFLMSDPPKGIALDQSKNVLYIAKSAASEIAVMDIDNTDIIGKIQMSYSDHPVKLVLSPDGKTLVAADYDSSSVSIIDTRILREVSYFKFPVDISAIAIRPNSETLYVFHSLTQSMSVIDLLQKQILQTQSIAEKALACDFNEQGDELYVIAENSPNLLIMDPVRLTVSRVAIGFEATAVKADSRSGLVYVGKRSGEILVIDPMNKMTIDSFQAAGSVQTMVIDHYENTLFTLSSSQETLQKFDLVSYRVLGKVETGMGNDDLVIVNQR